MIDHNFIYTGLAESLERYKDQTALRWDKWEVSYGELKTMAARVAAQLRKEDVTPGGVVGVCLENPVHLLASIVGIVLNRGIFCIFDHRWSQERLRETGRAIELPVMVCSERFFPVNARKIIVDDSLFADIEINNEINNEIDNEIDNELDNIYDNRINGNRSNTGEEPGEGEPVHDLFIYTLNRLDGTIYPAIADTALFSEAVQWESRLLETGPACRIGGTTVYGIAGITRPLFISLLNGAALSIPSREVQDDTLELLDWADREQLNVLYLDAGQINDISINDTPPNDTPRPETAEDGETKESRFQHLKWVIINSEGIEPGDLDTCYRFFPVHVRVAIIYGVDRGTVACTFYLPSPSDAGWPHIPVGQPVDGADFYVLDEDMDFCDEEFVGDVFLISPLRTYQTGGSAIDSQSPFFEDNVEDTGKFMYRTGRKGRELESGDLELTGTAPPLEKETSQEILSESETAPEPPAELPVKDIAGDTAAIEPEPEEKREYYPLSSAQKRLYVLQELDRSSTAYNMPGVTPLPGAPDMEALKRTVAKLIQRHESLRTSFEKVNGEPMQRVHDTVDFELLYVEWDKEDASSRSIVLPFDLTKAPLMRAAVAKLGKDEYVFWMDIHHLISDGTSHTFLFRDFRALYNHKLLAPLPLQYKDFSQWQNRMFTSGGMKKQEEYWLGIYHDPNDIPRLQLPTDFQRPANFTFQGGYVNFVLEGGRAASFKRLVDGSGGTLYMNVLAVLNVLFYKYTGQRDIIIGTGVAGRRHADLQRIIGMFVNTLPMRNFPKGEDRFQDFLEKTVKNAINAFENQDYQFEMLVDKLTLERDTRRNPLFDVCMVVQNFSSTMSGEKGDSKKKGRTSKFDLTFFVWETRGKVNITIEYYSGIFKGETVERMGQHLMNIVSAVSRDSSVKIGEIDMVSDEEKDRVLHWFNQTSAEYPHNLTVPSLFAAQVERTPHATAVVYRDRVLTYKQLDMESGRIAAYLTESKQTRPGEPVGIWMNPGPARPTALLGILKAGAAFVPLDPELPRERVRFVIEDAAIRVMISEKQLAGDLNHLQWETSCLDHFLCTDTRDIYLESPQETSQLMDEDLWRHVGETSTDDITGGGWLSSFTGLPFSRIEMDEYGDNILKKLTPLLHKNMRVLEIGCASGISMFRIAPQVGFYYGTDLSAVIIEKNKERAAREGHKNIKLQCLRADEIHLLEENQFDLVIINSVIQCFGGYNYLRGVLRDALDLMAPQGILFAGDIMDLEKKKALINELTAFKYDPANRDKDYNTKIDFSSELFLSKDYWRELQAQWNEIEDVGFSEKIHTVANELTQYRYDVQLRIDKTTSTNSALTRIKYCDDLRTLDVFPGDWQPGSTPAPGPDDFAYIIYTSGTTGRPKGVVVHHRALVNLCSWHNRAFEVTEHDHAFQYAGFGFDAAVWEFFPYIIKGSAVHILSNDIRLDLDQLNRYFHARHITIGFLPTQFCEQFMELENSSLRILLTGGDKLRTFTPQNYTLYNNYGPTENTVVTTSYKVTTQTANIPIGPPIDNNQTYILNTHTRQIQPVGVPGELYISGASLAEGYLNNPELTAGVFFATDGHRPPAQTFTDFFISKRDFEPSEQSNFSPDSNLNKSSCGDPGGGPSRTGFTNRFPLPGGPLAAGGIFYKTGDLVRWLPDGNIEFLGRVDRQVKVRGFRIEVGEIEVRLFEHPLVAEAVVVARDGELGDGYLCAYIVAREEFNLDELAGFLSLYLPGYMVPGYFVSMERLPLNSSGKVDRRALPVPEIEGGGATYSAPATEMEKQLIEIWAGVLNVSDSGFGIDDNFFELGGHSLKATILVSRIHKEMDIRVPLAEIFNHQTIRSMAAYMAGEQKTGDSKYAAIEPAEKRDYYPLSSAQKRMYILQEMDRDGTSYNIPNVFPLGPDVDLQRMEDAFNRLVARHESLRTSFLRLNGEPVQRVHDCCPAIKIDVVTLDGQSGAGQLMQNFVRSFDLSSLPLLRVCIARFESGPQACLVDMHHIISDGTSHAVLIKDFIALYEGKELPALRLHYKDFSQWQNRLFLLGEIKAQQDYWLALYADAPAIPRLDLSADFKRPDVFTFAGDSYDFVLDGEDAARFREIGSQRGGTLFMNLLALLNVLFYKYTRQTDIIIGSGIAGRPHADLQGIIGMFINMLAMRNFPDKQKTYGEFLDEVVARSIEAFDNQDVQFEELVDMLELERDPSRNPLFDISLVVQNFQDTSRGAQGQTGETPERDDQPGTTKFDMTVMVMETDSSVNIHIEYYTGIFAKDTIRRLARHFKNILRAVNRDPGVLLREIEIISPEEKVKVVEEFNRTQFDYRVPGSPATVTQMFEEQVEAAPRRAAMVADDHTITYQELNRLAGEISVYLRRTAGIRPGQPAGILLTPCFYRMAAVLGVLKAGGVYVPLEPSLPLERIKYMVNDAGIEVIISEKQFVRNLNRLQWECQPLRRFLCVDTYNIGNEIETASGGLMDLELWRHVGETATDDISGGGWVSSFTGQEFFPKEMDEYGNNVLEKLTPLLKPNMRVLEIGCASGITMFRIAPLVEYYLGTDLSDVIIEKNKTVALGKNLSNIKLQTLAAHDILDIGERDFDLIIINSVIQCFPGYNYLRDILHKCFQLLAPDAFIFIGDVMDLDLKNDLIRDLEAFKYDPGNRGKGFSTKTDFSSELFISKAFWHDFAGESGHIRELGISSKIHTIKNELTQYRYDVLLHHDAHYTPDPNTAAPIKKYRDDLRMLRQFPADSHLPALTVDKDTPAYVIYTSGSTGKPKGVLVGHRSLANNVLWQKKYYHISPPDNATLFASFGFDAVIMETFPYLISGSTLHILDRDEKLDPVWLNRYFHSRDITISFLPTQVCEMFIQQDNRSLRALLTGGDKLRVFTPRNYTLYNNYGPTENTVVATAYPVTRQTHNIPIGKPVYNNRIYILDPDSLLPQPIGVPGEIYISGAGLAEGYLNNPELTAGVFFATDEHRPPAQTFTDIFYKTGDLGRWLPDGNIEFFGRVDTQVKVRGYRIEVGEIETCLLGHKLVDDAVVVVRSEDGDNVLCGYVVLKEPGGMPDFPGYLAGRLPGYMVPSYFIELDSIPLNPSGKVDRRRLPAHGISGKSDVFVEPRDETERQLVEIWAGVLGLENAVISIHDNFFDLGGHSLKATTLAAKIHEALNVKIPLGDIFKIPTIANLAQYIKDYIKDTGHDMYSRIQPAELKEYYPLSAAQRRLFLIDRMTPGQTVYNMPQAIPLDGAPGIEALEDAVKQLIYRHESLRTSFIMLHEQPVQQVHDASVIAGEFQLETLDASGIPEPRVRDTLVRPFDLSRAPLLRVVLVTFGNGGYMLFTDMHHIVSDGVSMTILEKEFRALYTGQRLPQPRIAYKDFAQWQHQSEHIDTLKIQEKHWLSVLTGDSELPVLNLPLDYVRPPVQVFEGNTAAFSISEQDARGIKTLAENSGTTLYMLLLGIFTVWLSKLDGNRDGDHDIIVGCPVAGRPHADLQDIIGMFVNTLCMRNFPAPHKTFNQFLGEVKQNTLAAYENQDYPFEGLVEKVSPHRDAARNPIFDVTFNLLNQLDFTGEIPAGDSPEPGEETYTHTPGIAKFDLNLTAVETGNRLAFTVEYCSRLFKPASIERFIAYFKTLVSNIQKDPELIIGEIDLLGEQEKKQLLLDFNRLSQTGEKPYPQPKTIVQLFEEQAQKHPDAVALSDENHTQLTYQHLDRQTTALASRLSPKGAGPDTIVALIMHPSIDLIVTILAVLKTGAAYLPIDPEAPGERVEYLVEDSGAVFVLDTDGHRLKKDLHRRFFYIKDLLSETVCDDEDTVRGSVGVGGLAYVIYTSGTTGKPKGVAVTHANLSPLLHWGYDNLGIGNRDRVMQNLSYYFDWSVWEIFITLTSGAILYCVPREMLLNPVNGARFMQSRDITGLHVTPTQARYYFDTGIKVLSLRYLFLGAEKLDLDLVDRCYRWVNPQCRVFNMYGPTEATIISAVYELSPNSAEKYRGEGVGSIPIGQTVGNNLLLVLDTNQNLSPINVAGELYIAGDGVARGYLNRVGLTRDCFVGDLHGFLLTRIPRISRIFTEGFISKRELKPSEQSNFSFYKTGDLVRWLPCGNVEFLGRKDHQVKIRGYRIETGEIESALLEHEAVKETIILEKTDGENEKQLCAYVVPVPGKEEITVGELKEFVGRFLPGYMVPAYFMFIPQMPLTPNGKLDRKALPEPALDGAAGFVQPSGDVELQLVEIWAELLGIPVEKISANANFFDLGGHSLKATVLTTRIHKQFNVKLTLADVFLYQTVGELALHISASGQEAYSGIEPAEEKEYYRLSPAQKRIYFIQQFEPESIAYNMPQVKFLDSKPDPQRLEQVVNQLIQRHESFRTSFHLINNRPVQRIHKEVPGFTVQWLNVAQGDGAAERPGATRAFDLAAAPLVRVAVLEANDQYVLFTDMHHIISDGVSNSILDAEIAALYSGQELIAPALRYRDYSEWLNSSAQAARVKKQEEYWLNLYKGELPLLDLPFDFPRPVTRSVDGGSIWFSLDAGLVDALMNTAPDPDITPFMVLLSVFNVFLHKISGMSDIVTGTPIAARRHADLQDIIGMFVNTLALRNEPAHHLPFTDFLKDVRRHTLQAMENQEYPFEELVDRLDIKRDMARNPLFDVMFSYQERVRTTGEMPGSSAPAPDAPDEITHDMQMSKFDITLNIAETADNGLLCEWVYCSRLFKKETSQRFTRYFRRIVEAVSSQPLMPIAAIDMITEDEKKQIIEDFNSTTTPFPHDKTAVGIVEEHMEKHPGYIAAAGTGIDENDFVQLTYGHLNEKSSRLASVLTQNGVKPGSIIPVILERRVEMTVAIIGIMKAGGAYLPIDYDAPAEHIRYILADSNAKIAVTTPSLENRIEALKNPDIIKVPVPGGSSSRVPGESFPVFSPSRPTDAAYVIYTSGTTGRPKGVLTGHRSLVNIACWKGDYTRLTGRDNGTAYASFGFDAAVLEFFMYLIKGAAVHVIHEDTRLDLYYLNQYYERHHISLAFLPTGVCEAFMQYDNRSLRVLMTGGDKLRKYIPRRYALYNNYGPTESAVAASAFEVKKQHSNIPIGKPASNTQIFILTPGADNPNHLNLQPVGIAGEIYITGTGIARGYINKPELTAERFINHEGHEGHEEKKEADSSWLIARREEKEEKLTGPNEPSFPTSYELRASSCFYKTGDLARWLPDGNIEFLGRVDNQVKIRGNRIEIGGIENRLREQRGVRDAVVVSYKDPGGSEYLCAYIVMENNAPLPDFRGRLLRLLPKYMVPAHFVALDEIPLTANGKLNRCQLPPPEFTARSAYIAPRTKLETRLVEAWDSVLLIGRDKIGVKDDFFEIGGDSIKSVSAVAQVNKICGLQLPVTEFFKHPTIEDLAAFIEAEGHNYKADGPGDQEQKGPDQDALKTALLEKADQMLQDYYEKPVYQETDSATQKIVKSYQKQVEKYRKKAGKEKFKDLEAARDYQHILVAGATGFLGSYLVREILEKTGVTVSLLVRGRSKEDAENRLRNKLAFYFGGDFYHAHKTRIRIVLSDLSLDDFGINPQEWERLAGDVDAVVNAAADSRHFGEYDDFYNINVRAVERMLQFCLEGPNKKDFHHMSTISVGNGPIYIDGVERFIFTEHSLDEGQKSDNPYADTKIESERMVFKYREKGVNASIYRLGNLVSDSVTGKAQENIDDNWFFARVKTYISMGVIPLQEGDDLRMTFIDHTAAATVLLMTRENLRNQVFHLSNPFPYGLVELSDMLKRLRIHVEAMDTIDFYKHLAENLAHPVLGNIARSFVLHSYMLDEPTARTMGIYFCDRTLRILKLAGFEWTPVNLDHIRAMLDHIRSIGFLLGDNDG